MATTTASRKALILTAVERAGGTWLQLDTFGETYVTCIDGSVAIIAFVVPAPRFPRKRGQAGLSRALVLRDGHAILRDWRDAGAFVAYVVLGAVRWFLLDSRVAPDATWEAIHVGHFHTAGTYTRAGIAPLIMYLSTEES